MTFEPVLVCFVWYVCDVIDDMLCNVFYCVYDVRRY